MLPKMSNDSVSEKIRFVSNNLGTTILEVMLVLAVPIWCNLFYSLILYASQIQGSYRNWKWRLAVFAMDQIFIALPLLGVLTVLAYNLLFVNILLGTVTLIMLIWNVSRQYRDFFYVFRNNLYSDTDFLTNYKAAMQMLTCICILAVDFNIFPRRFAKTERFGVSVMDLGVGSFVLSMALTSRAARSKEKITLGHVGKTITQSIVLIFLGIIRVVLVKSNNYQEHVSEYGVHWNFFFTLAVVRMVAILILYIFPFLKKQLVYLVLSVVLIGSYHSALTKTSLGHVFHYGLAGNATRLSFFDANREGIISSVGYLSIYFLGLFFGVQLFKTRSKPFNKMCWLCMWLLLGCVCLVLDTGPISRQLVNLPYYIWQLVVNCFFLLGFFIGEAVMKSLYCLHKKHDHNRPLICTSSILSQAVTQNLLVYFLFGNVLTGFVNLYFDTLQLTDLMSFGIISLYMLILNTSVWFTYILGQY